MMDRQTDEQTDDNHDNSSTVTKVLSADSQHIFLESQTFCFECAYSAVNDTRVWFVQPSRLQHLSLVLYQKLHTLNRSRSCLWYDSGRATQCKVLGKAQRWAWFWLFAHLQHNIFSMKHACINRAHWIQNYTLDDIKKHWRKKLKFPGAKVPPHFGSWERKYVWMKRPQLTTAKPQV